MRYANTIATAQDDNEPTFGHESDKKRDKVCTSSLGPSPYTLEMFSRGSANAYDEIVGR